MYCQQEAGKGTRFLTKQHFPGRERGKQNKEKQSSFISFIKPVTTSSFVSILSYRAVF